MSKQIPKTLVLPIFLVLAGQVLSQSPPSARDFTIAANQYLAIEKPYDYHRSLAADPVHRPARNRERPIGAREMEIADQGWAIVIPSAAGTVLKNAARDFQDYLATSMAVQVELTEADSIHDWPQRNRSIVVGTGTQLPGCGSELDSPKDYRLQSSADRVVVCGYDEPGAAYGLYNLEARMNLREGPFLPESLDAVRQSLYQTRMTLSWLGWMEWPDNYLSHLAHDGFDAIYASVYANPNGADGPSLRAEDLYSILMFGMKEQSPEKVHDLVKRAARFGIRVYVPIIFRFTGEPENEASLRALVREIVTEFPDIAGYILLTEGFYYNNWFGAGGQGDQDLLDWAKSWVKGVAVVTEECHRINPRIEVLPWEYNIDFRPNRAELKRQVVSLLPTDSIPLLTWENGKSFEIDGLRGYLRDYSLNQVGPSEVTAAQIAEAKARGMKVYSKADTFASWQFGTAPYIPAPYQWYKRYQALEEFGVDGTHESWSNGYKPNFIAEMRAWYCWSGAPPLEELLTRIARRDFGTGSEALVLGAWKDFSHAITLVPDTGPSMGTNFAIGNPLFFEAGPPRTMTLEHSWRDPVKWRGYTGGSINPYWPYTANFLTFFPDFTNQQNRAEAYARSHSGIGALEESRDGASIEVLPVFEKYLLLAADGFEQGLEKYRKAALQAPPEKRRTAMREVLVAEQIQRMLRSDQAILAFENDRFRLAESSDPLEQAQLVNEMTKLLGEEIIRTEAALDAARRDSRLGYEFEQDYVYSPYVLEEKLEVLRKTLTEQIPAYRRNRGF